MGARLIYQLATPYTAADLADIDSEQSADVMYLAHPSYAPAKLARHGHTDWSLSVVDFATKAVTPTGLTGHPNGDTGDSGYRATTYYYVVTTIDATSGEESLPSALVSIVNDLSSDGHSNTLAWVAAPNAAKYRLYKGLAGGRFGYVGTPPGIDFTDDNIEPDYSDTPPAARNPFIGTGNQPGKVTFYQQRLVFGRTANKPNGVWTSQSSNFENLNVASPPKADDAITFAMVGQKVNAIAHLVPMKKLLALTGDALFSISGPQRGYISPSDLAVDPESYRGASAVRPVPVDDFVFFNTSRGATIRTIGYQFSVDGYKGNDLGVFAPHLFEGFTLKAMAWCEYPLSVLFCARSDGALLALTWQSEQDVWGWSMLPTDGLVLDLCTVSEDEDRLYALVQRTAGGSPQLFVERLSSQLWSDYASANFLDSATSYAGAPINRMTGLDHLEGKTVWALADGSVMRDLVVAHGYVDLPNSASKVIVGLPYDALIETLPMPVQAQQSIQGRQQQVTKAAVLVKDSLGLLGGSSEDELFLMHGREVFDPVGVSQSLESSYMQGDASAQWGVGQTYIVKATPGLPMTVLSITPSLDVGGD